MVQSVIYVTCLVVFSMHVRITRGFACYLDFCDAGRQYCVQERQRCFHCSDREGECGQANMPGDCAAYCAEVSLKMRLSELNGTNEKLRTDLNKTHSKILQLEAQIKDSQNKAANSIKEHTEGKEHLQNVIEDWKLGCPLLGSLGWVLFLISILWQSKKCLRRLFKRKRNLTDNAKLLDNHEPNAAAREPKPEVTVDMDSQDKESDPEYEDSGQGSTSTLDSDRDGDERKHHTQIAPDKQIKKRTGPMSDGGCECGHSNGTGVKPCKCNQPVEPTKGENSERAAVVMNPTQVVTYKFPVQ